MRVSAALSLAGAALALVAAPARAENYTVTTPADGPGPCVPASCTLRGALETAVAADAVRVPAGDYVLTLGEITVPGGVTVTGASARTTIVHGPVASPGAASFAHLTMNGGVRNDGTLTLDRVRVTGGSGIVNHGSLTLGHSLVDANPGGGVLGDGTVNATDSTIALNGGDGVVGTGGTLTRVTVARNDGVNVSAAMHIGGSLVDECGPASDGGNVVPIACAGAGDVGSDDPKLATALASAGGETDVLRIAPGSAAVDAAGPCLGTDQRELPRPQGTACDAGAYELEVVRVTGPQGLTRETPVTFDFQAAPGSAFRCALDGGALAACTSPMQLPGLVDGDHTFTVQAFAGEDAVSDPATRAFTLDTTRPPAPEVSGGPDGFTVTSAEAGAALACSLDGGAFEACGSGVSYPGLSDGEHVLAVRATDMAGNASVTEHRFTVAHIPAATPAPAPPTVTPTPVATPSYRKTVVLRPQAGRTLIRRPGETAFAEIRSRTAVAIGTSVDVKQGTVIVIAATASATETAKFSGGVFTAGGTDLTLSETLRCGRSRRLTGDGAGAFRIRGRYASATGRGAKWTVEDTCKQTRIRVVRGVVAVLDKRRSKTALIRSGRSYTARPKR
jgi:hypothetical protein